MFKPKQPQSNNNQPPTRQRLPLVDRAPRQEDVAALFTGAMRIKGCSFELPVQPSIHSKIYLVTCQFDNFTNETVWSMYEGEQGSLQLWTCPHSDLDLVFDMVCMSAGTNKGANTMPAEVAQPAAVPQPAPAPQYPPPAPAPAYPPPGQQYSTPHQTYPPQQQPQPYSQPYPAAPQQYPPQPQTPYNSPQPPYNSPYPPAQPYPPQQTPYPQQQQPYPQPGPAQPYPNPEWAPQPQQPFYQQPSANPAWTGQPAQQPFQAPYTPSAQAPTPAPSTAAHSSKPLVTPELSNFIDLINKGTPNLLLGHLFVEAGIVPEKCLDAALKCQELVRVGKLTNEQAVLALKRAAELGGILDDDVIAWARDPEGARAKSRASANRGNTPEEQPYTPPYTSAFEPSKPIQAQAAPAKPTAGVSRDVSAMQKVIELLKQAGLVSEADVETARKVRSKHGGDLGQILVSAGKVGTQTMDAASRCQELVTNGRLRIDKAIAALHYCERMRAGLSDALDELHIELL